MRIYKFPIDVVVRPLMLEILDIAKAAGHDLGGLDVVEEVINVDPVDTWFRPSMLQDVDKVSTWLPRWLFHNLERITHRRRLV